MNNCEIYNLDRNSWLTAVAIAVVRMNANKNRRENRDRGDQKNLLNDIQGVLGELVSTKKAEKAYGIARVVHDIVDFTGPINDVDLKITQNEGDEPLRIEVKCLLWNDRKLYFLINAAAHNKAKLRKSNFYFPVLSVLGGPVAFTGSLFAIESVDDWEKRPYGYGDPALGKLIASMFYTYFGSGWTSAKASLPLKDGDPSKVCTDDELLLILPAAVAPLESEVKRICEESLAGGVNTLIQRLGSYCESLLLIAKNTAAGTGCKPPFI